jgi:hypothetical protein
VGGGWWVELPLDMEHKLGGGKCLLSVSRIQSVD